MMLYQGVVNGMIYPLSLMEFAGRLRYQRHVLGSTLFPSVFTRHGLTCLAITS